MLVKVVAQFLAGAVPLFVPAMSSDVPIDAVFAILLAGTPVWILIGLVIYHAYKQSKGDDQ